MHIISVVGTRPQILKLDKELKQKIIWTGQHYNTLLKDIFFKDLNLPRPDYECNERRIETMISKVRKILKKEKPDIVLVYGDCRSTLAGAIAAREERVPIAHIESGMRAFRREMPEEMYRRIIDNISQILFTPCEQATINLSLEGIREGVHEVGNVLFDTFSSMCPIPRSKDYKTYSYLTMHRDENVMSKIRMEGIFEGLSKAGRVIFLVHPRTQKAIKQFEIKVPENIEVRDPVSYKNNLSLIANARKVYTDSGGVQNEAYWLKIPVVLFRKETEWVDAVHDGWVQLVDADPIDIEKSIQWKPEQQPLHLPQYGAKERIRNILYA